MTCGPSRWDAPGEKTRHLLHRVSHKFTATCVCLAWQGPQTRLPGPPPHPTAIRQNKPGAVGALFCHRQVREAALVLVCLSDVRQPGHREADVEGWVWVRLSEHPCSPVLLGISGPSADDLPLRLSSFLPCSCPPPSTAFVAIGGLCAPRSGLVYLAPPRRPTLRRQGALWLTVGSGPWATVVG